METNSEKKPKRPRIGQQFQEDEQSERPARFEKVNYGTQPSPTDAAAGEGASEGGYQPKRPYQQRQGGYQQRQGGYNRQGG